MATLIDGGSYGVWGPYPAYAYLYGDVSRSGNTITISNITFHFYAYNAYASGYPQTIYIRRGESNVSTTGVVWDFSGGTSNTVSLNNASFSVGATDTSAGLRLISSDGDYCDFTVSFPSGSTPPTGLSISDLSATQNTVSATISIDSWGIPDGSSNSYREINVSYSGTSEIRRFQKTYGASKSSVITATNSSEQLGGMDINPNTLYYVWAYATNGTTNASTPLKGESIITLPPALLNKSVEDISLYQATVRVQPSGDGGYYTKTVQYSFDNSVWHDGVEISTPLPTYHSFTLTDLTPATDYTIYLRVKTTAGITSSGSLTFRTLHDVPSFSDFGYYDSNSEVVEITGDNQVLIEGKSQVNAFISRANKAVAYDGAVITKYVVESAGKTIEIPYADADVSGLIGVVFGDSVPMKITAYDSFGSSTSVTKSFPMIEWSAPSVEVFASRGGSAGDLSVSVEGSYSSIVVGGVEKNTVTARYRVLSQGSGEVVVDWNNISLTVGSGVFSGSDISVGLGYFDDFFIEFEVRDVFGLTTASYIDRQEDKFTSLDVPEYTVELWGNQGRDYIADISTILVNGMRMTCPLNDVEDLSFAIDLIQFEKRCEKMNVNPEEVLYPYVADVRVKRNGKYIFGGQVVEANISIDENKAPTISVKCTGFLNLFKDQYVNEAWSGYTYAELARKIVDRSQKSDNLIKNPTSDIDISYWIGESGSVSYYTPGHSGKGCLRCQRSSLTTWLAVGTGKTCPAGTNIGLSVWVKGDAGLTLNITEREYETISSTQITIVNGVALTGDWQEVKVNSYNTTYENGYIHIECNNGQNLYVDDCYVYSLDDDSSLHNLNVALGVDTASQYQDDTRERAYDLQNAKDAIVDLTNLEDDNFDFAFGVDRTFNCYARKGSDKLEIEAVYPGNISSMEITRSASDLANRIHLIGSGIGDERLEVWANDNVSRAKYGNRESVLTNSNVSLVETLKAEAEGVLKDLSEPTNLPKVTIKDGSINLSNVEVGDGIVVRVEGDSYLESINGLYRIMEISANIDNNNSESLTLTLEAEVA